MEMIHATACAILLFRLPITAEDPKLIVDIVGWTRMKFKTKNFNRACFMLVKGAKRISMEGHYPNYEYTLEVSPWLVWYEKAIGLINYQQYINERIRLKIEQRQLEGWSTDFTGRDAGFPLADMAVFKDDSSVEKWKKMIRGIKKQKGLDK